ncbi:hypothetical protein fugu_019384 [Takifugu bimaculatus]|uniref:Uncharacterized protein n=1 Tax=Takifugu bimaculatus TaxID=433685 RepID=A0A4Z2BKC0_9TELE|nr:hypothetical protein fugu_019384 [Takifugu bimaculatus]
MALVSPQIIPEQPAAFLLVSRLLEQLLIVQLPEEVFSVLLLLVAPFLSPLAQAAPTQPAAQALGCLDRARHPRSDRALGLGKAPHLGVTPQRRLLRDSALAKPLFQVLVLLLASSLAVGGYLDSSSHHLVGVFLVQVQPMPAGQTPVEGSSAVWEVNQVRTLQIRTHSALLLRLEGLGSNHQLQTLCLAIVVPRPLVLDSPPSVNKKPAGLSLQARGALHPKGSAPILLQQNQVVSGAPRCLAVRLPSAALNHLVPQHRLVKLQLSTIRWVPRLAKCLERERQLPTWADLALHHLPVARRSVL